MYLSIVTDHQTIRYLDSMRNSNPRLTRWVLALQPFRSPPRKMLTVCHGKHGLKKLSKKIQPTASQPVGGGNPPPNKQAGIATIATTTPLEACVATTTPKKPALQRHDCARGPIRPCREICIYSQTSLIRTPH